jgi:hypothetical protein
LGIRTPQSAGLGRKAAEVPGDGSTGRKASGGKNLINHDLLYGVTIQLYGIDIQS